MLKSHPINFLSHPDKLFLLSSFFLETNSLLLQTISPLKPDTSYHGCLHSIFVSLKVSWLKPSSSITLSQFLLYANLVWYSKIAHSNRRYSPLHGGLIVINHCHEILILRSWFSTPWYYYTTVDHSEERGREREGAASAKVGK